MSINKTAQTLFILTAVNAFVAALSYALTILLANFFGPSKFGIYSQIMILAGLLSIMTKFGTEQTAAARFVKARSASQVMSNVFAIKLLFSIPCFLVLTLIYAPNYVFTVCVFLVVLKEFDLSFFYEIEKKNKRYSYINLFSKSAYVIGAFALILIGYSELLGYFILLGVLLSFSLFFQLFDHGNYKAFRLSESTRDLYGYIVECVPITVVALSSFAFGGFSRLILENKLGPEKLGIYSLGWQLVTIGTIFTGVVYRIWRLRFAEAINSRNISELFNHLRSYVFLVVLPILILSMTIASYSDFIVRLLFSIEYAALSELLPLFSSYIFLISIAGLLEMLWVATGKTNIYMIISLFFSSFLLIVLSEYSEGFQMRDFLTAIISIHAGLIMILGIVWYYKFKSLFI
ncbi:oligosaccharide flippase family protein [Pelagibacterales bacterium]|nr:oligosaccharide flippase family protein [Pelagibacterales bacterium]